MTFNEIKTNLTKQRSKEKIEKADFVFNLFPRVETNMKRYIKYNF